MIAFPVWTGGRVFNYGYFSFESKEDLLKKAAECRNFGKVQVRAEPGTPMVIDRRKGYFLYDMTGKRLIHLHHNGGTCNSAHRSPELIKVLKSGRDHFDIGNHRFASVARAASAEKLVKTAPQTGYAIFGAGGAEAAEIALETARHTTRRRKTVSIGKGHHGQSGLSVATGDERLSRIFLADRRSPRRVRSCAVQRCRCVGGYAHCRRRGGLHRRDIPATSCNARDGLERAFRGRVPGPRHGRDAGAAGALLAARVARGDRITEVLGAIPGRASLSGARRQQRKGSTGLMTTDRRNTR